jgi:hypothetical protein
LILQGRDRQLHPRYAALSHHYLFDPKFCMPARGQEKPDAEGTVKAVQRRFATPVPRVANLGELNISLLQWCQAERARVVQSLCGPFRIADRLAEELAAAWPLPAHRFDPCVIRPAVPVDKYQTVAFDNNRYSVPRPYAFPAVAVKGYVGTVAIVAKGQVVATHMRCLQKHQMVIEPIHYLALLDRKPGVLDCAPAFRDRALPACFAAFRTALEQLHGATPGPRRFVRVLQLLAEHPLARVRQAVEECIDEHIIDAETVIQRTRSRAAIAARISAAAPEPPASAVAAGVQVPVPDLSRFDQLLGGHEDQAEYNSNVTIMKCNDLCVAEPIGGCGAGPAAP